MGGVIGAEIREESVQPSEYNEYCRRELPDQTSSRRRVGHGSKVTDLGYRGTGTIPVHINLFFLSLSLSLPILPFCLPPFIQPRCLGSIPCLSSSAHG